MSSLPQQAQHFQHLLRNLPTGAFLHWSVSGKLIANEAFHQLLPGIFTPQEKCNTSTLLRQLSHAFHDPSQFQQEAQPLFENTRDTTGWAILTKEGQILSIDFRFFELENEVITLGTFKDVTVIKQAIDRIKLSEEKYRVVLENMDLGVLEVDNDGIIVNAFDKFCELTGYSKSELIGANAMNLLIVDEDAPTLKHQTEERKQGKPGSYEVRLRHKDGHIIWVMISGTPLYNDQGEVTGSFGIHLDITKLKETENALLKETQKTIDAIKWKENIMARMSHEMRTPINGIMGMISLLLEEEDLPGKQKHNLQTIKKSANTLRFLIEDLLDYAVLEHGEMKLEHQPFNLYEVVDSVQHHFSEAVNEKNSQLVLDYDSNIPDNLQGDPAKIGQVLKHLISNAVKFSDHNTIRLDVKMLETHDNKVDIQLSVTDYGIGIPPNELKNILRGFYQIEQTQTINTGVGIGLSMVKLIMDRMDGELDIDSTEGNGTTVTLFLTLHKATIRDRKNENAKQPQDIHILIAEDNVINQMLLKENLARWNFSFDLVENGQQAVHQIKEKDYDLVLMDVQMPVMDGLAATRYIRKKLPEEKQSIPILALTAYGFAEDRNRCLKAGMNDYISKPFSPMQLFYKITDMVPVEPGQNHGGHYQRSALDFSKVNNDLLNPEKIEVYTKGNVDMQQKIIRQFLDNIMQDEADIKKAWAQKDWKQVFEKIHRLKPTISLLGMTKAAPLVAQLNEELRDGNPPADEDLIARFLEELELAVIELRKLHV